MLPHLAKIVDDICLVKSVRTDQFNHAPAQIFFNTGFSQPGRPCLGSWALYGLGAETQDLPAFVVMCTGSGHQRRLGTWSSGFLPTIYTGVRFRNQGDPILNVVEPAGRRRADCSATRSTSSAASINAASPPTATRRSPRASPPTRWPSACRPPRRN